MLAIIDRSQQLTTGTTRTLWLHMLKEGGRWTATELAAETRTDRRQADRLLRQMATIGHAVKFEGEPSSFGVTPDCRVPREVTLADLHRAEALA